MYVYGYLIHVCTCKWLLFYNYSAWTNTCEPDKMVEDIIIVSIRFILHFCLTPSVYQLDTRLFA